MKNPFMEKALVQAREEMDAKYQKRMKDMEDHYLKKLIHLEARNTDLKYQLAREHEAEDQENTEQVAEIRRLKADVLELRKELRKAEKIAEHIERKRDRATSGYQRLKRKIERLEATIDKLKALEKS